MNQAHGTKIGVHKYFIHNPHYVGQNGVFCVEGCHEQRHIGGRLMINYDERSLVKTRCDVVAEFNHCIKNMKR